MRESPAIEIVKTLLAEQCSIRAYDPAAMPRAQELLNGSISCAEDPYEAAEGADALLILTDWEDFAQLDLRRIRQLLRYPIVIDGRNLYSCDVMARNGLMYVSMGRPTGQPASSAAAAGMLAAK